MKQMQGFGGFPLAVIGVSWAISMGAIYSGGAAPARADDSASAVSACALPVCDMDQEVERYRAMRQNGRFDGVKALRAVGKKATDLAVLKNLAEFGARLEALFKELKEESWMIGEAQGLRSESLLSLAKFSELNAEVLVGYYRQISGESARYEVFKFWRDRIKEFEDKASLFELMEFFARIAAVSESEGDPAYLARDSRGQESVITARLIQLYPYYEGTYRVSVTCDEGADTSGLARYCGGDFINRLVIMDSFDGKIRISLANAQSGTMLFNFSDALLKEEGTTFEATDSPSGVPSQLKVVIDRKSGTINGTIRNADSLQTVRIDGKLEMSPAAVFDLSEADGVKAPVSAQQLSGLYRGTFAGRKVSFTLSSFGEDRFGATMAFDQVANYRVRFQASRFYPKLRVLVLVGSQPGGSHLKLALFFKDTAKGLEVSGLGFTDMSGAVHELSLVSAAK